MTLIDAVNNVFPPIDENIESVERYSKLKIKYFSNRAESIDHDGVLSILGEVSKTDRTSFTVCVGSSEVHLPHGGSIEEFVDEVNSLFAINDDGDKVSISLEINKDVLGGNVNIYSFKEFCKWVESTRIDDFLSSIKGTLVEIGHIKFTIRDEPSLSFRSERLTFNSNVITSDDCGLFKKHLLCDFNRISEFPFKPCFFRLIDRPPTENSVSEKLDSLEALFLLTGIFDQSILKENSLRYKINGYRTYEGTIEPPVLSKESAETYTLIYNWIYAEPAKIIDKIGLARNILTIYLKNDSLEIEPSAYPSTLSGFNVYLQKNLDKYIEIRSKLNDELTAVAEKASKLGDDYFSNYQKSLASVISFFVSVIVLRVLSTGNFERVFTYEALVLTFLFIGLSVAFFVVALFVLNTGITRLGERYNSAKNRYKDLLIEADISRILRDDAEFDDEIREIKYRRCLYSILWLLTLVGIALITFYLAVLSGSQGIENLIPPVKG